MKFQVTTFLILLVQSIVLAHGTMVSPASRVYRVFQSNIENPNFLLAQNAINTDTPNAYYTWNQVSQNIAEAVQQGLPAGFDYSPWVPNGNLASGGRVDPLVFGGLTYHGLDQVSPDWPTTSVQSGEQMQLDFLATTPHDPSVWDFWMTTESWNPNEPLSWDKMEFLGRLAPTELDENDHYFFDLEIPSDRSGHHVLWVAWHRNDPVGEVFFSTSDLFVEGESCPDNLMLDNIFESSYQAAQSISTNAQVLSLNNLDLRAGNFVELLPFFELDSGITLQVLILACHSSALKVPRIDTFALKPSPKKLIQREP